jgi:hypothetical protein
MVDEEKKKEEKEGFAAKAAKGIAERIEKAVPKVEKFVKEEVPKVEHAIERGAKELEKGAERVEKAVGKGYHELVEAEARRPKVIKAPEVEHAEIVGDPSVFLMNIFDKTSPDELKDYDYSNIKKMVKIIFGKSISTDDMIKAHKYFWAYVKKDADKLKEMGLW